MFHKTTDTTSKKHAACYWLISHFKLELIKCFELVMMENFTEHDIY